MEPSVLKILQKQSHRHDFDVLNYPDFAIYSALTLTKCLLMPLQYKSIIKYAEYLDILSVLEVFQ